MPTVLLVAHHYPPHVGGLELVVERQARSLVENGCRVVVLTSRVKGLPGVEHPQPGLEVIRVPCAHFFEKLFFIPFPIFSPRLITETWRQLKRVDLVHLHDVFYMSSWVVALLARISRKPMLLTQHVAMVEHRNRLVMWIQRLVYATAGRAIFAMARTVIVYNENVRTFLHGRGVADARILPLANGIDTGRFRPVPDSERRDIRNRHALPLDRPLVLFVGRLVEKKGYQILLDAKDSTFDLVFVGPGDVPANGRTSGVHWLGPLDQMQTAEVFQACDVFAFPAVGEVFTLAMQEAMASGLPVVTTDDPAYAGSIVSSVVILCPRRPECFTQAIRSLLADSARRRDVALRGREIAVKYFDWRENFKHMMYAYSSILENAE
jgi:D-inositol-3-phosphate glycosyltransferase